MLRGSKSPLKVKGNERSCPEEKEETSFPLPKDPKSCKVTKPKAIRACRKENFSDGEQPRPQKRVLKCPKGPEGDVGHPQGVGELPGSCFGALRGDLLRDSPLPLDTQDFPIPLGNDFSSTPGRDRVEGNPALGLSEQRTPPDFAAVPIPELGIPQEGFAKRPKGTSNSLKFRRRSTIGLRGSPENNTLIRYLAQQRSSRQKETFTQISPFKHANVRSLKDKIDAFQTSFESLQEAEDLEGSTQEAQNKTPFKKEPNLEQWSEKFTLGTRGAALKENWSENVTKSSRRNPRICSILSPTPTAAKEWIYEQPNPVKCLDTVTGDILETNHVLRCEQSPGGDAGAALSPRKVGGDAGAALSPRKVGGDAGAALSPRKVGFGGDVGSALSPRKVGGDAGSALSPRKVGFGGDAGSALSPRKVGFGGDVGSALSPRKVGFGGDAGSALSPRKVGFGGDVGSSLSPRKVGFGGDVGSSLSPRKVGFGGDVGSALSPRKVGFGGDAGSALSPRKVGFGGDVGPALSPRKVGGDAGSALSPRKVGFGADVILGMLDGSQTPTTPLRTENIPCSDLSQSSSLLRSILKKTPGREILDSPNLCSELSLKEYSSNAIDRGGGEAAAVSTCVKTFEMLQTDTADTQSSKTPKKKKVTFGEVLSPEIFDQTLPANTPLRRGASPGCPRGPNLRAEPLPLLDFAWDEECIEPPQEILEDSVAAEAPSPAEKAEVAEIDTADMVTTRSSTKRKSRAVPENPDGESGAPDTPNDKDTKIPTKNKIQRQKNPTTAAPKKSQKMKYPSFGRRRKKKAKKSIYGEREIASKKPLLSPIPEIPEVFSAVSTPNSPKADALSTEGAALANPKPSSIPQDIPQQAEAGRSRGKKLHAAAVCPSLGDTEVTAATSSGAGHSEGSGSVDSAPQFSNVMPDAESDFDTSEYFQRGKETPCEQAAKESSSLIENEKFQGNLLTGLEILTQHIKQEAAQRTEHPPHPPASSDPPRRQRRRSSSFYLPPAENLEVTGVDLAVSSYNVEEILSIPRGRQEESQGFPQEFPQGFSQGSRRRSNAPGELQVRRSMRLSRDAAGQGLAWVELPSEIPKEFPPAAPPKGRRGSSTSILAGAENVHPKKQSLSPLPAPGKENESSAALAAAPGRGRRRRSSCGASARAEPAWASTQRRRSTNSGWGKDRRHQKHPEETETLELRVKEVPGLSDFLK